jgi:flagellar basal-body rod protein FlgC
MDYTAAFQISASGMAVEKTRLEVAAMNIANMHSAGVGADQTYRPLKVITQAQPLSFAQHLGMLTTTGGGGVRVVAVDPTPVAPRLVYEPGHPYADKQGMVAYPAVDHTAEMLQLNTALRAYEANVVAMNAARTMASRALEIGGQS